MMFAFQSYGQMFTFLQARHHISCALCPQLLKMQDYLESAHVTELFKGSVYEDKVSFPLPP